MLAHSVPTRALQLVLACVVLGVGVGLVLTAGLGSDGYSTLVNGVARASGVPYALANWGIGFAAVGLAFARGVRPGVGTITHPVVVGLTVNLVLDQLHTPQPLPARVGLLALGAVVLAFGVAGYLEAGLGAGPFEAVTLAVPLPFRVAYALLQAAGALGGWALGADIGVGTLVIVVGVGPLVVTLRRRARLSNVLRRWTAERCTIAQ